MKLLKQTVLAFAEGRSEKVYEVDLCEVGANQFVVNFRYGKRGTALKDGSKTVAPVGRADAERIFDKLVATKMEQGYAVPGAAPPGPRSASAQAAAPPPPAPGTVPASEDPRARFILERLAAPPAQRRWFRREGVESTWRLERAIWRAGELRIREAEPLLLQLVGTAQQSAPVEGGGKGMRDYCIAWALGFCGSAASVSTLGKMYADTAGPEPVRRIAGEALLKLSDEQTRDEFRSDMIDRLPESLRDKAKSGRSPGEFTVALAAHLRAGETNASVLEALYSIDNDAVRPAVVAALDAPFKAPFFRTVRHLFKAAEYRRDPEIFGRIAHQFEKQRSMRPVWDGRQVAPQAFGKATRTYLRRRVWRTLRRLAQAGDPAFVPMAVGVLLPFTDDDAVPARVGHGSNGRIDWDRYAPYWAFNHILYSNSPRYVAGKNTKPWRCKARFKPGDPPPPVREEAFPALWDQNPAGLMHLCAESRCLIVHEFAARALTACTKFCDELDLEDVIMLLGARYEPTARLGFEIAARRYDASRAVGPLLLAIARSNYAPGREQAFKWIDAQRVHLMSDSAFVASLVLAPHADTRAFARRLLRSSTLAVDIGQVLVGRLVAGLLAFGEEDGELASEATRIILATLASHLRTVSIAVIRDLVRHVLAGVQELGAELLLLHDARTGLVPDDLILGILHSQHEVVRSVGMRLIAELPDEVLVAVDRLLLRLCTDKNADIRNAARPIVKRIASTQPEAAEFLAQQLVAALLRRKLADDVPSHVLRLLKEELAGGLDGLPREAVWRLLQSGSPHAQELGGILLAARSHELELDIDEIVKLASHEILSVRKAAWTMFEKGPERVLSSLAQAVRILDAKWEDSRRWGFEFFRGLPPEAFTVPVVTTIIDSVREDVQAFGREMVQRSFRDEDGPELLRRLSEHPSRNVQLFTTNYLERYATAGTSLPAPAATTEVALFAPGSGSRGHEGLLALMPYFTSVLSRVNQGRIAKSRVLLFLRKEGCRSEEAARVVVGLLHRLTATIAIEDRGAALEAMVAIHHQYPGVPLPIRFKTPELRKHAV